MAEEARRPVPWKPITAVLLAVVVVLAAISVFQFVTRPIAEEFTAECPTNYGFDSATRSCVLLDQIAPTGISSASLGVETLGVGTVGSPITFDGSGSQDNVAVTEWRWDFGDGTEGSGQTVQHIYYTPGSYVVSLTVKDAAGNTGTNEAALTRVSAVLIPDPNDFDAGNDTAPVASLGLDKNVVKIGDTVIADASSSWIWVFNAATGEFDLGQNDSAAFQDAWNLTIGIEWGDGTTATGVGATHSYTAAGNYAVRITATGWNGLAAYAISTIHVLADPVQFPGVVKNPDTFIWATISAGRDLDPAKAYDSASGNIIRSVYEPLITWDRDSLSTLKPILAADIPTIANGGKSPDGLTYTFNIRQNVKFHNGDTLDAFDVEYTLERNMISDFSGGPMALLMEPLLARASIRAATGGTGGTPIPDAELAAIGQLVKDSIEAVDASTVKFNLAIPFEPFLAVLAGWGIHIMNKDFMIDQRNQWDIDAAGAYSAATIRIYNRDLATYGLQEVADVVGTGPYKLVSWDRDVEYVLVRFDDYWQGPAPVKNVVVKNIPEWGTRKLLFLNGDADWTNVPKAFRDQVVGAEGTRLTAGFLDASIGAVFFNLNISTVGGNPDIGSGLLDGNGIPPTFFADVHIRRAFSWLFDYATYLEEAELNLAIQPLGPVPKPWVGYTDTGPKYSFDLAKAAAEFNASGWPNLWDTGFRFTGKYNEGNVPRQIAMEIIRDTLKAMNPKFIMDIRGIPFSVIIDDLISGHVTAFGGAWGADYPDPHNFAHPFMHSEGFWAGFLSYSNASVDGFIDDALLETDPVARAQLYFDLQEAAFWDPPAVWRAQPTVDYWERTWVSGIYFNPITNDGLNQIYFYDMSKG